MQKSAPISDMIWIKVRLFSNFVKTYPSISSFHPLIEQFSYQVFPVVCIICCEGVWITSCDEPLSIAEKQPYDYYSLLSLIYLI